MTSSEPPAPKRHWRRKAELEQAILAAGRSLLTIEGLTTGVEHLTFKRVFDHLEETTGIRVSNSSVIGRIWRDQVEFQQALLGSALDENVDDELDASLDPVVALLEEADRSSIAMRWVLMRELCRIGGEANLDWITQGPTWPIWVGAWAAAVTGPRNEHRAHLAERMHENYERYTTNYEAVYAMIFDFAGFRMREPLTIRQFSIAVGALVEGCGLRDLVDSEAVRGILLPTGPEGRTQEWSIFTIGLEALLRQFVEPFPGWRPPADHAQLPAT